MNILPILQDLLPYWGRYPKRSGESESHTHSDKHSCFPAIKSVEIKDKNVVKDIIYFICIIIVLNVGQNWEQLYSVIHNLKKEGIENNN